MPKVDMTTMFTLVLVFACVVLSVLILHKVSKKKHEPYEYRGGEVHRGQGMYKNLGGKLRDYPTKA